MVSDDGHPLSELWRGYAALFGEPQPTETVPNAVRLGDVAPAAVEWLWPGRIPRGRLTLIVGPVGAGKSLLACDLVARVTAGRKWPDQASACAGSALMIVDESRPGETIRPRLDAARGVAERTRLVHSVSVGEPGSPQRTEERVDLRRSPALIDDLFERSPEDYADCVLVVIDAFEGLTGPPEVRPRNDAEVFDALATSADRWNVAVVVLLRLGEGTKARPDRGLWDLASAVGSVWLVLPAPDGSSERWLLPARQRVAGKSTGLRLRTRTRRGELAPHLVWRTGSLRMTALEALNRSRWAAERKGTQEAAVEVWLRQFLAAGPRESGEIHRAVARNGFSYYPLRTTLRRVAVKFKPRTPGPWYWGLPEHVPPGADGG